MTRKANKNMNRMMRRMPQTLLAALTLVLVGASSVQAGPAEDYADGAKRYAAGDVVSAMPILRRAADAGHAAAQATLAEILDLADSDDEAIEYFRKSAIQGNADGQYGLGAMLSAGEGTEKNVVEARKWITAAAEQGHKLAINELAAGYILGTLGIKEAEREDVNAQRWIRLAAENGFLPAMERMAYAYKLGNLGAQADAKIAKQWEDKVNKARGVRQGRRGNRNSDTRSTNK